MSCIRCRRRFSSTTDFNAATARRARFVRRSRCMKEGHAKNDDEIREWMSGNLCRCGAYPNIVAAIKEAQATKRQRMNPFTYSRATDAAERGHRASPRNRRANFSAAART